MRFCVWLAFLAAFVIPGPAQNDAEGPINPKAQKTYKQALGYLQQRMTGALFHPWKAGGGWDPAIPFVFDLPQHPVEVTVYVYTVRVGANVDGPVGVFLARMSSTFVIRFRCPWRRICLA